MIDSVLNFISAQAARNDPVLSAHLDQLQAWRGSYVIPGVRLWRASQDVTTVIDGTPSVLHSYMSGWSILIALQGVAPGLLGHPNLQFMVDRERAAARSPGMIVRSNVTQAVMQDLRFEPVFAGSDYPWGAWQ